MIVEVEDTETFIGMMDEWARARTGVHRTTVMRWRQRGWPPWLLRLAALEVGGHLGLIHPSWNGWRIERTNGNLVAPVDLATRPFKPGDLIAVPLLHQLQRELDRGRFGPKVASKHEEDREWKSGS